MGCGNPSVGDVICRDGNDLIWSIRYPNIGDNSGEMHDISDYLIWQATLIKPNLQLIPVKYYVPLVTNVLDAS